MSAGASRRAGIGQNRSMPPVHSPYLPADHACLIVHGSDKPGIVAAVSAMITRIGGNIVAFDQFSDDHRGGAYFQRVVFHRPCSPPTARRSRWRSRRPSRTSSWSGT